MSENQIYFGTEIKVNVSIEPIGSYTMDDYDFQCEFYCYTNRRFVITKGNMIREDANNWLALLKTELFGKGSLKCKITAYIPDADCDDGLRTEVLVLDTGIQIIGG